MKYMREEKKAKRVLSTLPPGRGRQRWRRSPPERREGKEVEAAQEGGKGSIAKGGNDCEGGGGGGSGRERELNRCRGWKEGKRSTDVLYPPIHRLTVGRRTDGKKKYLN